jgi:hypothetical protein
VRRDPEPAAGTEELRWSARKGCTPSEISEKSACFQPDALGCSGRILGITKEIVDMKLRIAAAAAAGLMGVGLAATPAQAEALWCNEVRTPSVGLLGRGCFHSYGDIIDISDQDSDGMRAINEWMTSYGRTGECHDTDGAWNGYKACNYDMDEDGWIRFRIVIRNGATGDDAHRGSWSLWFPIDGEG